MTWDTHDCPARWAQSVTDDHLQRWPVSKRVNSSKTEACVPGTATMLLGSVTRTRYFQSLVNTGNGGVQCLDTLHRYGS